MYDIIGDIHGCNQELWNLLGVLGYEVNLAQFRQNESTPLFSPYRHPEGRIAVFVGDLCDRGPGSPQVIFTVMQMVEEGTGLCVMGNHDNKLMRALKGNKIKVNHGLQSTLDQLREQHSPEKEVFRFLESLPVQLILDDDKLHISHAGLQEKYHGVENKKTRAKAFYGVTTGKTLPNGFPERIDWAQEYTGRRVCVHGHVRLDEVRECNNVWNVDTSCVYGNKLSALRYPEMEIVSTPALAEYYKSTR